MNSLGHLLVSIGKSIIRIGACVWSIYAKSAIPLAWGFMFAEVLGIVEELVDKRN